MTDESNSIVQLNPHTRMTVEQALQYASTEHSSTTGRYQDVMILAYDADGELVVRSSEMSRKDALWMLMKAVDHARGV